MPSDIVWVNSLGSFDAIAGLRAAAPSSVSVRSPNTGDGASDDVLRQLVAAVERSVLGVSSTVNALANEATLIVLGVIDADNRR